MKRNSFVIIAVIVSILVCSILLLNKASHRDDWKKSTTPLPEETIKLLCSRFGLSSSDSLCNGKDEVYALDFVPIIKDKFRPYETYQLKSSEAATYDEVEEKMGIFMYECESEETTGDGLTFFSCSYDLRGDRKFVMTILFTYPEKAVMRIMSTSRFDDY